MRLFAALAPLLCMPFAGTAAEIPKGAHVLLRMMNSINTRTAAEGDQVYLQTASPIAIGDQIVIPAGSYVQGVVSLAKRGGKVSGRAELAIRLETLTMPGGKTLKIAPRLTRSMQMKPDRKSSAKKTS